MDRRDWSRALITVGLIVVSTACGATDGTAPTVVVPPATQPTATVRWTTVHTDTLTIAGRVVGRVDVQDSLPQCANAWQRRGIATLTDATLDSLDIVERATFIPTPPVYSRPIARVWRISGDSGRRGATLWQAPIVGSGGCGTVGGYSYLKDFAHYTGSATVAGTRSLTTGFAWWSGITNEAHPFSTQPNAVTVVATRDSLIVTGASFSFTVAGTLAVGVQGNADTDAGNVQYRVVAVQAVSPDSASVAVERKPLSSTTSGVDTVQLRVQRRSP